MSLDSKLGNIKCDQHESPQDSSQIGLLCFNQECTLKKYMCYNCISKHESHIQQCVPIGKISGLLLECDNTVKEKRNILDLEIDEIFTEFRIQINNKLDEVEKSIKQGIKTYSQSIKISEIKNDYQAREKVELKDLQQLVISLQTLVDAEQMNIKVKDYSKQLNQLKESLKNLCGLGKKQILELFSRMQDLASNAIITIPRLDKIDITESWPYDKKNITIQPFKVIYSEPIHLNGFLQPRLKDEFKTARIKYRIHQGFDLNNVLFEKEYILSDKVQELTSDNKCYKIYTDAIRLLPNQIYTISAQSNQEEKFRTICYQDVSIENNYVDFKIENQLQDKQGVIYQAKSGIFPQIFIKSRDE